MTATTKNALETLQETFGDLLLDQPPLLKTPKTIQVLVLRQTHDYTIFRTEETRELNIVALPRHVGDGNQTLRVAMLASKQKAPENRLYAALANQLAQDVKVTLSAEQQGCYLKDNLCRQCPRCILFGAVATERGRAQERWNIKHRIEYSTAYSVDPYEAVAEMITFNAVDSATQSTGRALQATENVEPLVSFPSVVSLNSVTAEELLLYCKTLMACRSYGAENRTRGDMSNHLLALVGGYEEVITSLEFMLEMSQPPAANPGPHDPLNRAKSIAEKYKRDAAFSSKVKVLADGEMATWLDALKAFDPDKAFMEKMYRSAGAYIQRVQEAAGRSQESGEEGAAAEESSETTRRPGRGPRRPRRG